MTIPFSTPNNRMFYACVGVLVGPELVGRNDIDQMSDVTGTVSTKVSLLWTAVF